MLTLNEYIKANQLNTEKYSSDDKKEQMLENDYYIYFGEQYINYIQACIIEARNTNSEVN